MLLFLAFAGAGVARPKPAAPMLRQDPRQTGGLKKGQAAPDFRLQEASGATVSLRELRGKVIYLDFWYSGCRPCLAEAPAAGELKRTFLGKDVVFVYISIETVIESWREVIAKHALASPNSVHLFDPEGWHAARAYGVQGFPTYMIIGRDGRVINGMAPRPSDGKKTVAALEQALAAK